MCTSLSRSQHVFRLKSVTHFPGSCASLGSLVNINAQYPSLCSAINASAPFSALRTAISLVSRLQLAGKPLHPLSRLGREPMTRLELSLTHDPAVATRYGKLCVTGRLLKRVDNQEAACSIPAKGRNRIALSVDWHERLLN